MTHNLRTFYTLLITQVLSLIGSRMTGFALGIWIYAETGNTTPLVLVPLFMILPYILLSSVAGVIADRFSRKWLILLGDAGQAIPTLILFFLFTMETFQIWHLYVAVITQSFFSLLQAPAFTASITMLVPDSHRNTANALREIAQPMAGLLAPPVAGVLYALIDVSGILALDLLTFVIAVVVISGLVIPQPKQTEMTKTDADGDQETAPKQDQSMWGDIKEALHFLTARRGLMIIAFYSTFLNFITVGAFPLILPYVLSRTDSEPMVGLIQGVFSFGLIAGGLSTTLLKGNIPRVHIMMTGMIFAGVGLAVFGIAKTPIMLILVGFAMALPYKMLNALSMSILQVKVPPNMQGRVFSLLMQVSAFAMPLSYLITGPLVDKVLEPAIGGSGWRAFAPLLGSEAGAGIGLYMLVCGSLLAIGTIIVYAIPAVRHIERDLPDYIPEIESPESKTKLVSDDDLAFEAT